MPNNLPPTVDRSILPVERQLPQPSPDATVLVRLVTDQLNPEEVKVATDAKSQVPVFNQTVWILNQPHPLASEAKIVRMYSRDDGGVEVYSSDGKMFVRTVLPERVIRFFDEAMSDETFVAFIEEAESEEEEEEPEPDPEPGQEPNAETDAAPAANGPSAAS
jgi:hypothetical protein